METQRELPPTEINFSCNWNKKLDCNYFTTIRQYNLSKYEVGRRYVIKLKNVPISVCKIIEMYTTTVRDMSELLTRLDAGMSKEDMRVMLNRMYHGLIEDKTLFMVLLLQKEFYLESNPSIHRNEKDVTTVKA